MSVTVTTHDGPETFEDVSGDGWDSVFSYRVGHGGTLLIVRETTQGGDDGHVWTGVDIETAFGPSGWSRVVGRARYAAAQADGT
ncbi:MAG: hypothetical protein HGA44_03255 [Cellulomonadaceae bacterium]|nr:hypothetical protein [Cellulomonadaceae bacterium]